MANARICTIEDCSKLAVCRGWCDMHYTRFKRHGNATVTKSAPEGAGLDFLMRHRSYIGNECVEWPYSKSGLGYGQTYYLGNVVQTHRLMCRLVHGEPSSPDLQAAHRCGNHGCINPRHIRWRTPQQNIQEKKAHGREALGEARISAKLSTENVIYIRKMAGKIAATKLAAQFSVSPVTIRAAQRRKTWAHVPD